MAVTCFTRRVRPHHGNPAMPQAAFQSVCPKYVPILDIIEACQDNCHFNWPCLYHKLLWEKKFPLSAYLVLYIVKFIHMHFLLTMKRLKRSLGFNRQSEKELQCRLLFVFCWMAGTTATLFSHYTIDQFLRIEAQLSEIQVSASKHSLSYFGFLS